MKRSTLLIVTLVVAIAATAFKVADDIIKRIGMEHKYAQQLIINNLVGNFSYGPIDIYEEDGASNDVYKQSKSFKLPYIPKAKLADLLSGNRAAATAELCEYVKKYVNSSEFIEEYFKAREAAMPLTSNGTSLSNLKKNKEVYEKNIANYKTDTKYVAEQQKLMEENQKKINALLEEAKKPFPGKDKWEKLFPMDPAVVVKKRLQEYLTLAATVDFNAKLTEPDKYKKVKFVNVAYEKKSLKWKAIFRAGKEVNDVVVPFVKEWLKGEIIAKEKTSMAEYIAPKNSSAATPSSNNSKATNNTNSNTTPVPTPANDNPATETKTPAPAKEKKSLFKKIKEKIGS